MRLGQTSSSDTNTIIKSNFFESLGLCHSRAAGRCLLCSLLPCTTLRRINRSPQSTENFSIIGPTDFQWRSIEDR
ncbi:hypothetical protein PC128_g8907 [Phytophthora cactorum]|nr:hypothetical protein PC128_g8907 [Phytophthora cactorum]